MLLQWMSDKLLPVFSLRIFMVAGLIFGSLTHFEFICVLYVLGYELNVRLPDFQSQKFESHFSKHNKGFIDKYCKLWGRKTKQDDELHKIVAYKLVKIRLVFVSKIYFTFKIDEILLSAGPLKVSIVCLGCLKFRYKTEFSTLSHCFSSSLYKGRRWRNDKVSFFKVVKVIKEQY